MEEGNVTQGPRTKPVLEQLEGLIAEYPVNTCWKHVEGSETTYIWVYGYRCTRRGDVWPEVVLLGWNDEDSTAVWILRASVHLPHRVPLKPVTVEEFEKLEMRFMGGYQKVCEAWQTKVFFRDTTQPDFNLSEGQKYLQEHPDLLYIGGRPLKWQELQVGQPILYSPCKNVFRVGRLQTKNAENNEFIVQEFRQLTLDHNTPYLRSEEPHLRKVFLLVSEGKEWTLNDKNSDFWLLDETQFQRVNDIFDQIPKIMNQYLTAK
jgi:hypothetical protein